ncbi:hypothetical protein ACHAWT_009901 [Skeletonema menzelii]|mmetsp:Transcript_6344/g.10327  ORF Transcript_6344/g.10327 Transcript_6344/m.10327 type:complete len:317 (-) Transcript_6344:62-1012(-)
MLLWHLLSLSFLLCSSAFTASTPKNNLALVQSYTLYDKDRQILGSCDEVRPATKTSDDNEEEDEVEMFYATTKRYFIFPPTPSNENTVAEDQSHVGDKLLQIRQTSFGCGRLGATVWPSAIALASLLAGDTYRSSIQGKRILELGSGCGLPTLTAKEVCCADQVLATDYWERENLVVGNRLVPKELFGVNLAYNVRCEPRNLDWHDELSVFDVSTNFDADIIVGSDLVYYPDDVEPLLQTLNILMKNGGGAQNMLLILPLPPTAEREALPEFRRRLEGGVLGNGGDKDVVLDELEMKVSSASTNEEEIHNFLRIRI